MTTPKNCWFGLPLLPIACCFSLKTSQHHFELRIILSFLKDFVPPVSDKLCREAEELESDATKWSTRIESFWLGAGLKQQKKSLL